MLLLLLTGEAVLLSMVASGAGGDGHLLLTKKLPILIQRVWSSLTFVATAPGDPRNNRMQEESCFFTAV
jgi:hypothetical protein